MLTSGIAGHGRIILDWVAQLWGSDRLGRRTARWSLLHNLCRRAQARRGLLLHISLLTMGHPDSRRQDQSDQDEIFHGFNA